MRPRQFSVLIPVIITNMNRFFRHVNRLHNTWIPFPFIITIPKPLALNLSSYIQSPGFRDGTGGVGVCGDMIVDGGVVGGLGDVGGANVGGGAVGGLGVDGDVGGTNVRGGVGGRPGVYSLVGWGAVVGAGCDGGYIGGDCTGPFAFAGTCHT